MSTAFPLPYLLDYANLVVEDVAIFCVAVLTAILVSAEGQGWFATILGDNRPDAKDRLHFNVFAHMSVAGTLCFFVAGFGWARPVDIDAGRFRRPGLYLVLSRLAGPGANLMAASIAASLSWLLNIYEFEDKVFSTIVMVNVTMAVYSLIIVPPLPGSSLLYALMPSETAAAKLNRLAMFAGPLVVIVAFLVIRLTGWGGVAEVFNPVVTAIAGFLRQG